MPQSRKLARQESAHHATSDGTRHAHGDALPAHTRTHFEPAFQFDFGAVRVHTDTEASALAEREGAAALTIGNDILFGAGHFAPESPQGRLLLAHELTHVVQNARGESTTLAAKSAPNDAVEREATTVAHRAAAGEQVSVSESASAVVAPGLLGWLEENVVDPAAGAVSDAGSFVADTASDVGSFVVDKASDAGSFVADTASSAGSFVAEKASDAGAFVANKASDAGSFVADNAAAAWGGIKDAGSYVYSGMKENAGYVRDGVSYANKGIDWLEDKASGGAHWLADKAEGIPVLEQIAQGGAWAVDQQAQLTGGALKGAASLLGGVGQMVANPVDTVVGLEAMAEHIRPIPGMPNPFQVAHGLYNAATTDATLAGEMNRTLNPIEAMKGDAQFGKALVNGMLEPYKESWDKGKYAEVGGRAIFDIGSLFIGAGEANAGIKGAEGAALASEAARGAEVANVVSEAARGAEVANVMSDAARGAEAATVVSDAARGSEAAALVAESTRGAETATVVADATRGADSANVVKDVAVGAAELKEEASLLGGKGGPTGAGFVDEASPKAIRAYEEIAAMEGDAASIAKQLGIDEDIVRQVKDHLFHEEHAVPVPDYAAKTVEVKTGKFAPDSGIADLWKKANSGTLTAEESAQFKQLMGHEYVESGLMKEGMPYTDPKAFKEGAQGYYNYPSAEAHGAHDLAPRFAEDPFGHWKSIFGEGVETPLMKPDLSNLPDVLEFIRKMKGFGK